MDRFVNDRRHQSIIIFEKLAVNHYDSSENKLTFELIDDRWNELMFPLLWTWFVVMQWWRHSQNTTNVSDGSLVTLIALAVITFFKIVWDRCIKTTNVF